MLLTLYLRWFHTLFYCNQKQVMIVWALVELPASFLRCPIAETKTIAQKPETRKHNRETLLFITEIRNECLHVSLCVCVCVYEDVCVYVFVCLYKWDSLSVCVSVCRCVHACVRASLCLSLSMRLSVCALSRPRPFLIYSRTEISGISLLSRTGNNRK